jgi:Acyltransferase family
MLSTMDGSSVPAAHPGFVTSSVNVAARATAASVANVAKKAERLANVERLRVFAMLEIVCFHDHADRLPWVGGLGLPTFLLLTNLFNTTLTERRGLEKFLHDKRERLFTPWIFWSLFYGAFLVHGALRDGLAVGSVLNWRMILAGTSAHLWFVPFALGSAAVVAFTQYSTRRLPDLLVAYSALALGVAVLLINAFMPDQGWQAPFPQWLIALPSAFFGLGLGRLVLAQGGSLSVKSVLPLAVVSLMAALACRFWQPNFLVWRYAVSLLLVLAVLVRPGTPEPVSKFMSPLLFGIYLAHHFTAEHVLNRVPVLSTSHWLFVVDFIVTALVVWALKFTPVKRFI